MKGIRFIQLARTPPVSKSRLGCLYLHCPERRKIDDYRSYAKEHCSRVNVTLGQSGLSGNLAV